MTEEFLVSIPGKGDKKNPIMYTVDDLEYYDDILREDNERFWRNVRGRFVEVFTPYRKGKNSDKQDLVKIARLPVEDVRRKFG